MVAAAGGTVVGLVNNAGIMDGFLPTAEITDEVGERVGRIRHRLLGVEARGHRAHLNVNGAVLMSDGGWSSAVGGARGPPGLPCASRPQCPEHQQRLEQQPDAAGEVGVQAE